MTCLLLCLRCGARGSVPMNMSGLVLFALLPVAKKGVHRLFISLLDVWQKRKGECWGLRGITHQKRSHFFFTFRIQFYKYLLSFCGSSFHFFDSIVCGRIFKNFDEFSCFTGGHKDLFQFFSSTRFIVLAFTFRYMIHFKLILHMDLFHWDDIVPLSKFGRSYISFFWIFYFVS